MFKRRSSRRPELPRIRSRWMREKGNKLRKHSHKIQPLASAAEVFGREQNECAHRIEIDIADREGIRDIGVRVKGRLGSAWRLDVDIVVDDDESIPGILEELLRHIWNTCGVVYSMVAIRARCHHDEQGKIYDCTTIGYPESVVHPAELYERFGPSLSAPQWQP